MFKYIQINYPNCSSPTFTQIINNLLKQFRTTDLFLIIGLLLKPPEYVKKLAIENNPALSSYPHCSTIRVKVNLSPVLMGLNYPSLQ